MTFQKGQSGNPGGRARERAFANAIRAEVAKVDPNTGRERLLEIARKTVEMAIAGDMSAIREIGDRLDGKPAQALDMHTEVVQRTVSREPMSPEEWAAQYCGRDEDEATQLPGRQA
jgi:Family of unknown function (DUF5681)